MRLTGPLGMQSAITSVYTFTLVEEGGGTLLKVSHEVVGLVDPAWKTGYGEGWKAILGKCFKAWVEENKPYTQVV